MKKILLLTAMCLVLLSCKSDWKPEAVEAIASGAAPLIATMFSCANEAAIKEDTHKRLSQWFKIEDPANPKNKILAATLCKVAMKSIIPPLMNYGAGKLPDAWSCTLESGTRTVSQIADIACSAVSL